MKNQFIKKHRKGFTLIEMMVSIFIFALVMTAIGAVFATQIKSYKDARNIQGDLENAQFALNFMSKTLRTAAMVGYGSSNGSKQDLLDGALPGSVNYENDVYYKTIDFTNGDGGLILYDFSQEACMIFTFRSANYNGYEYPALWLETQTGIAVNESEKCLEDVYGNNVAPAEYKNQRLTTGSVLGNFFVAPTKYHIDQGSRSADSIGKATVSMDVEKINAQDNSVVKSIKIQSTTSMRDYPSDLSF